MHAICYLVNVNDNTTDDEFVERATNLAVVERDGFGLAIQKIAPGGQLNFGTNQLVCVGGKRSIIEAFASGIAQATRYNAAIGQLICYTYATSTATRERAIAGAKNRAKQVLFASVQSASQYPAGQRDQILDVETNVQAAKVLVLATKQRLVIRFRSAANGFAGHAIANTCTGALISLSLRQHFQI